MYVACVIEIFTTEYIDIMYVACVIEIFTTEYIDI